MRIDVKLKNNQYPVIIEKNCISRLSNFVSLESKFLIVSDSGVPSVYIDRVKSQLPNAIVFIFNKGEKNKNLSNYTKVLECLLENKFSRHDYLIAVGGGVVGDLAGFAAATYKRGINFINIPTTTLSMVDSSVGGKVAVNHGDLKNVVGTFYQPVLVLIDTTTLETLPKRHYINGVIEALKTGLIGDEILFNLFFTDDYRKAIDEIIYRSLKFKALIVSKDEKENGIRKILNFGHTFGHAYESYYDMKTYLHGEAVALGIMAVSKNQSYYHKLKDLFESLNIKTNVNVEEDKIINLIKNDKKADGDFVDLIVVEKIGEAKIIKTKIEDLRKFLVI